MIQHYFDLHSLRMRIAALSASFIVTLCVIGVWLFTYHEEQQLRVSKDTELRTLCQAAAVTMGVGLSNDDFGALAIATDWLKIHPDLVRVLLIDDAGEVIASFSANTSSDENNLAGEQVGITPSESAPNSIADYPDIDIARATAPVMVDGALYGQLIIERSLKSQRALIRKSQIVAVSIGAFILLVGILVSFRISSSIVAPIIKLRDATKSVAWGEYHHVPEFSRKDEIQELASFFNVMVDEVSRRAARQDEIIVREIDERGKVEAEREELGTRLRQSEKMGAIGTLAGGIAHDFNNILTGIIGYTDLVMRSIGDDSKHHKNLTHVYDAGLRARDLVSRILTFSRQAKSERTPIDMAPIFHESIDLLRAGTPSGIVIKEVIDCEIGMILADSTQLHQVIMNLCTNAFHAMSDSGGTLFVGLDVVDVPKDYDNTQFTLKADSYVCLTVSDSGIGMSQETIDRIFEPFFTTKGVGEGTGLGLATIHGIVGEMDGAISVHSKPGAGATFLVYFPIVDAEANGVSPTNANSVAPERRILVVDDEELIADLMQAMLEKLGHTVTVCNHPVEALEILRDNPNSFDLIITDYSMPKMTGAQLATQALEIVPDIPILLVTGYRTTVTKSNAAEEGFCAYLAKPFTSLLLAEAISVALERGGTTIGEQSTGGVSETRI